MGYWGKIIGGVTGFAMGGPFGAEPRVLTWSPARVAALFGRKDQLFAITAVVLSAKLAKCDGPVGRAEIDRNDFSGYASDITGLQEV